MSEINNLKENLIHKMYKKNVQSILKMNNLTYTILETNDLFILSDLQNTISERSIVVGGACIDRCEAMVDKLGINFYFDVLNPIEFALSHNIEVAIYVDTPIEVFGNDNFEESKWIKFSDNVENFLNRLGNRLGLNIKVIRREKGAKILDKLIEKNNFVDESLKGLYDMVPSRKELHFSEELLLHFRRSICSYLPEYLSNYIETKIDNVFVVEEFSQTKAISRAKLIDDSVFLNIYVDMPSVSGKNRMHRSPSGQIPIFSSFNYENATSLFNSFIDEINFIEVYKRLDVSNFRELIQKLNLLWFDKGDCNE